MICAFSDSDWVADLDDIRSTSCYCTYFGRNLISWSVKKKNVVARSSTKAEYRSLAHAASEVSWLNSLLSELKIPRKGSPVIWVDNLSAMALASNPVLHARTKHIELDIHFVRDKVLRKEIELRHVPTHDQIADILTKPLHKQSLEKFRARLGVVSLATLGLRERVEDHGSLKNDKLESSDRVKENVVHEVLHMSGKESQDPLTPNEGPPLGAQEVGVVHHTEAKPTMQDHSRTWKDILLLCAEKKS